MPYATDGLHFLCLFGTRRSTLSRGIVAQNADRTDLHRSVLTSPLGAGAIGRSGAALGRSFRRAGTSSGKVLRRMGTSGRLQLSGDDNSARSQAATPRAVAADDEPPAPLANMPSNVSSDTTVRASDPERGGALVRPDSCVGFDLNVGTGPSTRATYPHPPEPSVAYRSNGGELRATLGWMPNEDDLNQTAELAFNQFFSELGTEPPQLKQPPRNNKKPGGLNRCCSGVI